MEDIITIRIKHRDKTSISMHHADISPVTTGCDSCFAGVLCGT